MNHIPEASVNFLRQPDVLDKAKISKSHLWDLVAKKQFPAPVKLSPRVAVWLESEVDGWMLARVAESRAAA